MSQSGAVVRLALRELWISFRLLVLLAGFVAAGVVVALLPAPFATRGERLLLAITAASALAGSIAAWSLAVERLTGRAGWLVSRSVPRTTLLGGWYVGIAGSTLVGLAATTAIGWFALPVGDVTEPARYALVVGVAAAAALAWVSGGLLAGTLAPPWPAAVATALVGAALLAARGLGAGDGEAAWILTQAAPGDLLRLLGALLALAAVLLSTAQVAMGRVEL